MAAGDHETPAAPVARQLGQALRQHRQSLGVTATAAAASARMSRVTWCRLEKGEATVALGALLGAAQVLGLELCLQPVGQAAARAPGHDAQDSLPLRIRLADYPQLRRLAWQLDGAQVLSPREVLGIYERNLRHLQPELVEPHERALIEALGQVFGVGYVFERPHHRRIARVLQALDGDRLRALGCLFGGGTAIALRYGEYRESVDIDSWCPIQRAIGGCARCLRMPTDAGAHGSCGEQAACQLRPVTRRQRVFPRRDRPGDDGPAAQGTAAGDGESRVGVWRRGGHQSPAGARRP